MSASYSYAKACFQASASAEEKQRVDEELTDCSLLMKNAPEFGTALTNPVVPLETKEKILTRCGLSPLTIRFLLALVCQDKLSFLPAIAQTYHKMACQEKGIMEATLVTPFSIDSSLLTTLQGRLERSYRKPFTVRSEVDPSLLGGAILFVDHTMLDDSLKWRLESLKHSLQRKNHAT